ncbi:type II toxin-antitoxin system MqsR family toxin [Xanthomonas sp. WHRI 1810A]|uniref:type II toxin-antitoxin system MqsR family toxin n=1 Tax=Xanthomonas sp. WHRI 1810A TaxID=3161565 RepID=UPI0032E88CF8
MQKHVPHCKLSRIHELISAGKIRVTSSSLAGAAAAGLDFAAMVDVIGKLKTQDFYKSMTSYADHKIWQDVYRPWVSSGRLYLKLTVTDDVLVVSFKEC